jgi:hypothetical protein
MIDIPKNDPDFARFIEADQAARDRAKELIDGDRNYQLLREKADAIYKKIVEILATKT